MINAELAHPCENELGEGIIWSSAENAILWTDILGKQFWRFDPLTRKATAQSLSERLCCFASLGEGHLIAGFASGLARYDAKSGQREFITALESDLRVLVPFLLCAFVSEALFEKGFHAMTQ